MYLHDSDSLSRDESLGKKRFNPWALRLLTMGTILVFAAIFYIGGSPYSLESSASIELEVPDLVVVRPASAQQIERIQYGLFDGVVVQSDGVWSVKSLSHENAYCLVAYLDGTGIVSRPGAWLLVGDRMSIEGPVYPANSVTVEFSESSGGLPADAEAWFADPACSVLLDYARSRR